MSCLLKLLFASILFTATTNAQVINNTPTYRSISADAYARLDYENDFSNGTDYYYTQGTYLEVVHPALRRNPISHILIHPKGTHIQYGIAYEQEAYTPTSYLSDNILYGDRPFAATLLLKSFLIATDSIHDYRFSSSLSTGIIGPGAGGYEIQDLIHRNTNNQRPHGWQYQVQNDVVLNYEVNYEHALINIPRYFLLNAIGAARLGTLSTRAALGITMMAGFSNNPFGTNASHKWNVYIYDHPQVQAIGYDATLQGGVFNRGNPYTIAASDVSRITFENCYGVAIGYRRLYLEVFQRYITKEFSAGMDHHSGGIQLGLSF